LAAREDPLFVSVHLHYRPQPGRCQTVFGEKDTPPVGIVVIKAQRFRSQDKNREDALLRLQQLVRSAAVTQKQRRPTKPTRSSQQKRMDSKTRRGQVKSLRGKVET